MQAIEITHFGSPEVLQLTTRAIPQPGAGECLIKVHAAGVNRPDVLQRLGHYPPPPGASDLLGLEVAGEVVGGDINSAHNSFHLKIGDRICALVQGGGYAQYCVAPLSQCLPIPNGLSDTDAATLPETFFTVWSTVFERAGLGALGVPETLLVQGGSSGIGVSAIQLASALGHRVFTTAGSADKCLACEQLGAERAINYRSENFVDVIKQCTNGRGVDVILDMVAGSYVAREIDCLADDGRLLIIALQGGGARRTRLWADFASSFDRNRCHVASAIYAI
jgi:NADPH2:quinone reductase